LTDKAFIKKRGLSRSSDAFSLENETATKFGLAVEKSSSEGTLISGNREQFRNIESEGFRVKILPNTNILEIGSYRIDTEKESHDISSGISFTENFKNESVTVLPDLSIPENLKVNWTHHLIQLKEPPTQDLIRAIEDRGVDVVEPISSYGLFVVGKPENVYKLKDNLTFVEWVGPFLPAYRINNNLLGLKGNIKYVSIGIYPPSDADTVKQTILRFHGKIMTETSPIEGYQGEYFKIIAEINSDYLSNLASLPSVRWLEYASPTPGLDGERETQIIAHNLNNSKPITGYKTWLSNIGLSGKDVIITICDTGVDSNQTNNTNGHSDLKGRQIKFIDYTSGRFLTDTDGHGTHVAGICLGNAGSNMKEGNPPDDFLWGQGIAPDSKFVTQNALFGRWPPTDWGNLTRDAVNSGANIMNNSWWDGGPPGSGYTATARRFDQLCRDPTGNPTDSDLRNLIIVFSAGNEGHRGASSITPPHEAKNPIIVGNSSTYRPNLGNNDIRGLAKRSSRGPAKDGRILPTIVAPGTNVSSAWSPTGNLIDWGNPIPNTNEKYMFGSGTSMAAPHISGCCALLVEWWKKRTNGKIPSLALLKAVLINSAEDIAGGSSGKPDGSLLDHIPNNDQGWGLVNLKSILQNGESRIFSDQKNPFTFSGEEHSIQVIPSNTNHEIRITLVWTDAPGATDANPSLVNDLDLEVVELATGKVYKGNNFSEGYSIEGGDFDNLNNIECVYIKNPTGTYKINVIASNIAGNASPPFNMTSWQDYVLVMANVGPIEGTNNGIIID
jgi:subtilisin family serine protease